jgi:hypothetical protein
MKFKLVVPKIDRSGDDTNTIWLLHCSRWLDYEPFGARHEKERRK